ncbi:MAG TPA: IS200/IS605 family transposase [Arcobacter sp.]|nr:IS200/IS605 family transposase [Arcobacter sp.]
MRNGNHTISQLQIHIVWVTKYRYKVLKGKIQERCREILIQVYDTEDIRILSGVVSKEHVHMHLEYAPSKSVSDIVKRLKGRSSRKLQMEFPELSKQYWGKHFWAIGYRVWSTGNLSTEMVEEYLEHHRTPSNKDLGNMMLE